MRLLVISQYFWPEDFRINELVSELSRRGHAITVLTGQPNYPDGRIFPAFAENPARYAEYGGARVHRVPMLPRGRGAAGLVLNYSTFALSATAFGLWRLRGERFDAIFVFEPSPVTVGLPAIALRCRHGWPIAFWVLDQWPETLAAVGVVKSKALLGMVGRLVSYIYRRCDVILAQSRTLVGEIRKYADVGQRIVYFPNWVESSFVATSAVPAPEVPGASSVFTVMFAGNIGEAQNFEALLDAAESLKHDDGIRWVIVGDGRAASWVRDEALRRGLQDKFLLLGRYPMHRMPAFFRHAGALLVSLKQDPVFAMTVPGKIQSYLASGLPVIGMLDGEGASVINEAGAGFTCPAGDWRQLAQIVSRLAGMSAGERREMGLKGVAYARREFDRDVLVAKLEMELAHIAHVETRSDRT